jgi:hypothetical protein
VLKVVVDQVRRPGDPDGHSPLPEPGGQIPQRLPPGVVDVGHGGGVEDDRVDRAGHGVDAVADPQAEVIGRAAERMDIG